jgi:hypothetical protein
MTFVMLDYESGKIEYQPQLEARWNEQGVPVDR